MTDRLLALISLIGLALFLCVVPIWVPSPDLIVLAVLCFLLAAFDFWRELFRAGGGGR
ncbi:MULTISPECIES: hypothetical protein [unclassified Aminobacter]|uniref:hypothetical protein n=1 Tax=unclassified Aminobacter TaxID=2644704 RepID=UPI0004AFAB34|nr:MULTISPECIES: hypothetical protein [unclassified Aminobacter]TWH36555.1 hypothetical protein L611_000100000370 [Aminobacter sp. J15]